MISENSLAQRKISGATSERPTLRRNWPIISDREYNAGPQPYQTLLETIGFLNCRIEKGDSIYSVCPEMFDALKWGMPNAVAAMFAMQYPFFEQVVRGVLNLCGCVPVDTMLEYMTDAALSSDSDTTCRDINMFPNESLVLDFHTIEDEKGTIYYFNPGIPDPYHYLQGQLDFADRTPGYKQFTLEEITDDGKDGTPRGVPPFCRERGTGTDTNGRDRSQQANWIPICS